MKTRIIRVALPIALDQELYYTVAEEHINRIEVGMRVLVPVRNKQLTGYVTGWQREPASMDLKQIIAVLDTEPVISRNLFELAEWISGYYMAPPGMVLHAMLPPGMDQKSTEYVLPGPEFPAGIPEDLKQKSPLQVLVLEQLHQHQKLAVPELSKILGRASLRKTLRTIQQKQWVRTEIQIDKESVSPRLIQWVEPVDAKERGEQVYTELLKKPSVTSEVYRDLIVSGEPVPVRDLESRYKNVRYHLKKLARDGLVKIFRNEMLRTPEPVIKQDVRPELMPQQVEALKLVSEALDRNRFQPLHVHGITGSGKTELYLRAAEKVLDLDKSVIVLVPEIGLTSGLMARFTARFGARVALLHSGLSKGERYDEWRRIKSGDADIAVGPRSAVFAPFTNLKLIIVDEEHDSSYKQNEMPHYHGRNVAVMRGKLENSLVILGSATPSMETFENSRRQKYWYTHFPERPGQAELPEVSIIDMQKETFRKKTDDVVLAGPLIQDIRNCLDAGEQCLLFINRKGFSSFMFCHDCKKVVQCEQCDMTLTYHVQMRRLKCHACQTVYPPVTQCPECNSKKLGYYGIGTQKVEDTVRDLFPGAKVARMDSDTMVRKDSHQKLLTMLDQKKIDILVGTQMIAKGHDYPDITVVGVVNADIMLSLPDFRAAESTFQLLTQVAGRAGRSTKKGKVIVQTFVPHHYAIQHAKTHDFFGFYEKEIEFRKKLRLPPFTWMCNIIVKGPGLPTIETLCSNLKIWAGKHVLKDVDVSGPAPAPIARIRGMYRHQMIVKSASVKQLHTYVENLHRYITPQLKKDYRVIIDFDPVDMM